MGKGEVLVIGLPGSAGVAVGPVRNILWDQDRPDPDRMAGVKKGEIIVSRTFVPDDTIYMHRASAFVTSSGGITNHAMIVAREMGVPAVVGATGAHNKLKTGQTVLVNGGEGIVYEYHEEQKPPSEVDTFAALAAKRGIVLPAEFLEKMKTRG